MTTNKTTDHSFKEGDILVSTWGYNRTVTTWYKVVRTTKCKVIVHELPTSYPTGYMSNTPGDYCMPVIDGKVDPAYPYVGYEPEEEETGTAKRFSDGKEYVKLPGRYGHILYHWDGKPGWVNCD